MKIVEFIFKVTGFCFAIISFIKIVLSPLIIGSVIGGLIYLAFNSTLSLIVGISFSLLGLLIGINWAINVWKKTGTTEYMNRLDASPDLDEIHKKSN